MSLIHVRSGALRKQARLFLWHSCSSLTSVFGMAGLDSTMVAFLDWNGFCRSDAGEGCLAAGSGDDLRAFATSWKEESLRGTLMLLSYALPSRRPDTLRYLKDTGLFDCFDRFVFTTDRVFSEMPSKRIERIKDKVCPDTGLSYTVYFGPKSAYLSRWRSNHPRTALFVDDRFQILQEVCQKGVYNIFCVLYAARRRIPRSRDLSPGWRWYPDRDILLHSGGHRMDFARGLAELFQIAHSVQACW